MPTIYLLMSDGDGTMRSIPEPWGAAVDNEEEAKRYVALGTPGYPRAYQKIKVYRTFDEAEHDVYHRQQHTIDEDCKYCQETENDS